MEESKTREIRIIVPEELFSLLRHGKTFQHLLNAKKEMLLAFRSLIDAKIEAIEKRDVKTVTKKKRIQVE
jgi:hypothetical protein